MFLWWMLLVQPVVPWYLCLGLDPRHLYNCRHYVHAANNIQKRTHALAASLRRCGEPRKRQTVVLMTIAAPKEDNNDIDGPSTITPLLCPVPQPMPTFEYKVTATATCSMPPFQNATSSMTDVLSYVAKGLGYPSMSQLRRGVEYGELVVASFLNGINEHAKVNRALRPGAILSSTSGNQLVHVTSLNHLQQLVATPATTQLVRVTRLDNPTYYPCSVTKYVFPPTTTTHDWPITVLYQDDSVAVVVKPPGMDTLTTKADSYSSSLQSIPPFCLHPPSCASPRPEHDARLPRPVHRLDRATRGLVVASKTKSTTTTLSRAFAQGKVQKVYVAIVHVRNNDTHDFMRTRGSGILDAPIDGEPAVTHWKWLASSNPTLKTSCSSSSYDRKDDHCEYLALLECRPVSGRMHQIRRHLRYCLGTPIVGDVKYDPLYRPRRRGQRGGDKKESNEEISKDDMFLCACQISLDHPVTGNHMSIRIPLPQQFRDLIHDGLHVC